MYIFEDEIIKPIKNFENYGISNKGFVYRLKYGLLEVNYKTNRLKPKKDRSGYLFVRLSTGGKTKTAYIHRLVAEHFLDNPDGCRYIKHKDGNKENNCVDNLIWICKGNSENFEKIKKLREEGVSLIEIAEKTGVKYSTVLDLVSDKKSLSLRIKKENYEKLLKEKEKTGESLSKIVGRLIEEFL